MPGRDRHPAAGGTEIGVFTKPSILLAYYSFSSFLSREKEWILGVRDWVLVPCLKNSVSKNGKLRSDDLSKLLNPKFEYRNPKQIQNSNDRNKV